MENSHHYISFFSSKRKEHFFNYTLQLIKPNPLKRYFQRLINFLTLPQKDF